MHPEAPKIRRDAVKFLVAGGVNTALTTSVYFLSSLLVTPSVAYAIAWASGIVFVAVIYPDRVFSGGQTDLGGRLRLVVATIFVFLVGLITLHFLVYLIGIHQIAFLITLVLTTILNFVVSRIILRRSRLWNV